MNAGRELDALIAEKVMGLPKLTPGQMEPLAGFFDYQDEAHGIHVRYEDADGNGVMRRFCPSLWMNDAWEVVEKMPGHFDLWRYADGEWSARFWCGSTVIGEKLFADTAPLAICLAALAATEVADARLR